MSLRSSDGGPAAGSPATGAPVGRTADRRLAPRKRKNFLGRQPLGLLFSAPYVIYILAVLAYPLGYAVYISFHDFFFTAPRVKVDRPFVGLDNYITVLSDPAVQRSFANIGVFLVINVPLTVGLSLVLANALNRVTKLRTFFRVSYYVPYVTASVAVVGVWLFLFNTNGLVNDVLGPLAPDPSWLVNSLLAMPSIAFFVAWKQLGFFVLLYLAALQNVPKELYEAAAVDGATAWHRFWYITLPLLRPIIVVILVLRTSFAFAVFEEILAITQGGPGDATWVAAWYSYKVAFAPPFNIGAGAASAYVLAMIVSLLAVVYVTFIYRRIT